MGRNSYLTLGTSCHISAVYTVHRRVRNTGAVGFPTAPIVSRGLACAQAVPAQKPHTIRNVIVCLLVIHVTFEVNIADDFIHFIPALTILRWHRTRSGHTVTSFHTREYESQPVSFTLAIVFLPIVYAIGYLQAAAAGLLVNRVEWTRAVIDETRTCPLDTVTLYLYPYIYVWAIVVTGAALPGLLYLLALGEAAVIHQLIFVPKGIVKRSAPAVLVVVGTVVLVTPRDNVVVQSCHCSSYVVVYLLNMEELLLESHTGPPVAIIVTVNIYNK